MNTSEKLRLAKLLEGLETPELKLSEKCRPLFEEFKEKYGTAIAEEYNDYKADTEDHTNPFVPNQTDLEEIDIKIKKLVSKRNPLKQNRCLSTTSTISEDPKRPWRINTSKERLLRINSELRRHVERSNDLVTPLPDEELSALMKEDSATDRLEPEHLREIVELAKKSFPNFQYRSMKENHDLSTTASGDAPHADTEE